MLAISLQGVRLCPFDPLLPAPLVAGIVLEPLEILLGSHPFHAQNISKLVIPYQWRCIPLTELLGSHGRLPQMLDLVVLEHLFLR